MQVDGSTEILGHGAEGRVFAGTFHGRPVVVKERAPKRYRVPELDTKLTRQRVIQEAKCMAKCRRMGVLTPALLLVDKTTNSIVMERVLGKTVKAMLKGLQSISDCPEQLATQIGKALALMHDADIVHGSLSKLYFFSLYYLYIFKKLYIFQAILRHQI